MATWYSVMSEVDPPVPEAEARALVRGVYGIEGTLTALPGERDQNLRVRAQDGRVYVFKLHHSDEDPAVVATQNAALCRIEARAPDLPTPRVVPSLTGELAPQAPGSGRILRLLTWVEGEALKDRLPLTAALRSSLGGLLGQLDRALSGLEAGDVLPPLMWDIQRLPELRHMVDDVPDAPVAARAAAALNALEAHALPALEGLPRQLIHNDANPFNVVAQGEAVSGLLDFGDMVVASRVQELAVAAAYYLEPDPLEVMVDLTRAYHAASPLRPEEVVLLPLMVAARCAQTVMIGSWRRKQLPPQLQYVLKNYERAALGLARLEALGPDAGERLLAALES